jgi:Erv1 / Alr family
MSCGCGRKNAANQASVLAESQQLLTPPQWGPILWKYLHCLAERMGYSGNTIVDTDQANYMEMMITMLPLILPCTQCQAHAGGYLTISPLPPLRGLYGKPLRDTVRQWLFDFHNHVRKMTQQPEIVHTIAECITLYTGCSMAKAEYTAFVQSVAAAVRQGWVRMDNWRKWYSYSERIRIISGNVVI